MRWLIVGASGMLGSDVRAVLEARGIGCSAVGRADLDLLDPPSVAAVVAGHDVVVNCAGWTAVDAAESHEAEAFLANATLAGVLARATTAAGARLLHVSSDYVFSGALRTPYAEYAYPAPRTAYGRSKAAGEWAVRAEAPQHALVVRTAWLYGAHGTCFPRTIARIADDGPVSVVADQYGQPTWTRDVADLMIRLIDADAPPGIWHATSSGSTSWYEFARAVADAAGLPADRIAPTDSATYRRPAPRPTYSVLSHERLRRYAIEPIGDWAERWTTAASEVLALEQLA